MSRDQPSVGARSQSPASFAMPDDALAAMVSLLGPVEVETLPCRDAAGRVLAQPITADRDSPPCDNSAMDGYAVRLAEVRPDGLAVAGEVLIGRSPPALPAGQALRISTGAPLPAGAEAVIRREDVEESPEKIVVRPGVELKPGQHIRRRGENAKQGEVVLDAGRVVDGPAISVIASFGATDLRVYRRVRVAILVTGNELRPPESPLDACELRDSNGPALRTMLSGARWIEPSRQQHAPDDPAAIEQALRECLADCHAVLLTGGVSMGGHDHVPQAIAAVGARIVFQKLPIRPGHPMLGAVGPEGQAILALPGNPVSVMVTARRFGLTALRRLAGLTEPRQAAPTVTLDHPDAHQLRLWWFRPVRLIAAGRAELVRTMGSGDMISAARSDGFVELPPDAHGSGPWPFWRWTFE